MSKNTIIVLVGLPGSGKSTYVNKLLEENIGYVVISTDNIIENEAVRLGKTYSEVFKITIDSATKQASQNFQTSIKDCKNIIYDQTNLSLNKRKSILNQLLKNYNKIAIVFDIPLDTIKERLLKREKETGKIIPLNIIEDMQKRFEMPTLEEGFDEIQIIKGDLC